MLTKRVRRQLRELTPTVLMRESRAAVRGALLKYDVSLPVAQWHELEAEVRAAAATLAQTAGEERLGRFEVYCFGHCGDQNLHLNVIYSDSKFDVETLNQEMDNVKVATAMLLLI